MWSESELQGGSWSAHGAECGDGGIIIIKHIHNKLTMIIVIIIITNNNINFIDPIFVKFLC